MGEDGAGGSDDYDPNADPKADPRERRRIRYEYRELIAETQKNRHDFIKPDSDGLHKALDKADNLFKGVRLTREAVLDSHFLVLASNLGSQQAQQLQTHLVTFDPDTFVQKLITFMGGRNITDAARGDDEDEEMPSRTRQPPPRLDWKKLGRKASVAFKRTPNVDFMFGPLSMEPPRRTTKPKSPRDPNRPDPSQLVKPKQLEKVEAKEEATTKEVDRLHQVLYDNTGTSSSEVTPVCLFKFIINPRSFGQTIENLFHLSFLVRDGRAEISLEDGLPVVSYEEMTGENEQTGKQQVVVHLTLREYKEIIKTFNITKPMIPPRPNMNHDVNGNQNDDGDEEEEEEDGN
ncbi:non-structural maintenance of chromosomes element 4 homolog A-like isoform X2 [Oculina patagonica]